MLGDCREDSSSDDTMVVATAFDKTLLMSELQTVFGVNMSKQDSFLMAREYIDDWVKKQVLLNNAEEKDIGSSDEIDKKVKDFKLDLIMYEYKRQLLSEKLDTNISLKETKAYYVENPENFELKQNIIRFIFIKMPVDLEKRHNFWNKFGNADEEELSSMAVMALKNGGNAFLDANTWLAFDDVLKAVPINTYNQEHFLNHNRLFKIEETNFVWYVNILALRIKDDLSPFEFVEDNIREILLNKRKTYMLEKLENEMVQKARNDNHVKINVPQYE